MSGVQEFRTETRKFHHTEIRSALEQYRDEELPGKIVSAHYPPIERTSDGFVDVKFAYVVDADTKDDNL